MRSLLPRRLFIFIPRKTVTSMSAMCISSLVTAVIKLWIFFIISRYSTLLSKKFLSITTADGFKGYFINNADIKRDIKMRKKKSHPYPLRRWWISAMENHWMRHPNLRSTRGRRRKSCQSTDRIGARRGNRSTYKREHCLMIYEFITFADSLLSHSPELHQTRSKCNRGLSVLLSWYRELRKKDRFL